MIFPNQSELRWCILYLCWALENRLPSLRWSS